MTSKPLHERIAEAVDHIREKCDLEPRVGLILGTGLGNMGDVVENPVRIPYGEIPGFAVSTAESHAGVLVLGTIKKTPVVAMQGRTHFYEGYSMQEITFPIRVLRALGAETLIVSNAVGSMNPLFAHRTRHDLHRPSFARAPCADGDSLHTASSRREKCGMPTVKSLGRQGFIIVSRRIEHHLHDAFYFSPGLGQARNIQAEPAGN